MAKSTAHKTRRRSPGEGSVYRFGTRWRGAVQWTELDGSRSRRIVNAATSEEARDLLDELRRDLRLGTIAPAGRAVTVGEYLTGWIERNRTRVRPSTWRQRESHVRVYLNPALGRTTLTRLSAADVERAIASFMKGGRPVTQEDRKRGRQKHLPISAQTARHIRVTLRIALGDAARDRLVSRNAAADARPPHLPHKPITFLSASEVWTLLDATEEAEFGPLYSVAAMSGLRLGELLGLRWSDVTSETLSVRRSLARSADGGWELAEPKTAQSRRTLPLAAIAREALDRQLIRQTVAKAAAGSAWQGGDDDLVFADPLGRHLDPGRVSTKFNRDLAAAGLSGISFHGLRHSAATVLLGQGVPLIAISAILGHASIGVTASNYAAVTSGLQLAARDAMDRAMAGVR